MAFCFKFSKLILFSLDFLFVLVGTIIIALGAWAVVDRRGFLQAIIFFAKDPALGLSLYEDSKVLHISAWVAIGIGILMFLIAFCGCWAVVSENRCLLITYASLLSFLVLIEVAAIAVLFATQSIWQPMVDKTVEQFFSANYRGSLGAFNPSDYDQFSLNMDIFMIQKRCCGLNNAEDFNQTTVTNKWHQEGRIYNVTGKSYSGDSVLVPVACCNFTDIKFLSDHQYDKFQTFMTNDQCPITQSAYNYQGCLPVLRQQLGDYKVAYIVTPVIILVLELVCIALASFVASKIKSWDNELYY